jgi:hypothetical protein
VRLIVTCTILGLGGGVSEGSVLRGCDTASFYIWVPDVLKSLDCLETSGTNFPMMHRNIPNQRRLYTHTSGRCAGVIHFLHSLNFISCLSF